MIKVMRFVTKIVSALFWTAVVALVWGFFWLASKPLDSTRFTPLVEASFSYLVPQAQARMEESNIAWDNVGHTLDLTCKNVEIVDLQGTRLSSFPFMRLKVNIWNFLRGRVLPLEMTSSEARFWLTRSKDGVLALGNLRGDKASGGVEVLPLAEKIGQEVANEALYQKIDIKNAVVFIKDELIAQEISIQVPEISLSHEKKKAVGAAKILFEQKDRPITADATYRFDFKNERHGVELTFQDIRPSALVQNEGKPGFVGGIDLPFSGKITFALDRSLNFEDADISIEGGAGKLVNADFWDEARVVKRVVVKGGYVKSKNSWILDKAEVDFGGPKLTLTAQAKGPLAKNDLWLHPRQNHAYEARVVLENLPMDSFGDYWPKESLANPRIWIKDHLRKGLFTQGEITLRGHLNWQDPALSTLDSGQGQIKAKGGEVLYLDGMPPVLGVDAVARFDFTKMDVDILSGHSGRIVLKPFTIKMSDLEKELQKIVIPVKLSGPTTEVIARLKGPPLGYADQLGLDPEDMEGEVDGTLTLRMPLLADLLLKDVEIDAVASLTNFASKKLVPGFEIRQGRFAFVLDNDSFTLDGPLLLRRVPLTLSWKTLFETKDDKEPMHRGTLTGAVDGTAWKASGLLDGYATVEGETPLTLHYEQRESGFSTLEGDANLRQATVRAGDLNWEKQKGAHARFTFAMEMPKGENIRFTKLDVSGANIKVSGTAELDKNTQRLVSLKLAPLTLGRIDARAVLTRGVEEEAPLQMSVEGRSFDISGLGSQSGGEEVAFKSKTYDLKVDKLYTSADGYMTEALVKGTRDEQGWDELVFTGKAQGEVTFDLSLSRREPLRVLSINSSDFGVALKGLGLTDGVQGGRLTVSGQSSPEEPRTIRGEFKVDAFKVTGAPFLARLFSAVSPFGFVDFVTGDTSFDRMKGRFSLQGDELDIRDLRAPGSVAGINMEGRINLETSEANLNGTVVPFSFFNSIIGSIPLIGDVITGGDGQGVIAASFTVKGPLSNSDISVNPVSLLTPGFLRNLFFGGDAEEAGPVPPKPQENKQGE